jgi:single-stranded DNA-binding protein
MAMGKFPLAVHHDDASTSWHTIRVFGDRAQRLQSSPDLAKGQQVEVIGYDHVRQVRARGGGTRDVHEIYAVAIRAR